MHAQLALNNALFSRSKS